jgi:hypothetical protein
MERGGTASSVHGPCPRELDRRRRLGLLCIPGPAGPAQSPACAPPGHVPSRRAPREAWSRVGTMVTVLSGSGSSTFPYFIVVQKQLKLLGGPHTTTGGVTQCGLSEVICITNLPIAYRAGPLDCQGRPWSALVRA